MFVLMKNSAINGLDVINYSFIGNKKLLTTMISSLILFIASN